MFSSKFSPANQRLHSSHSQPRRFRVALRRLARGLYCMFPNEEKAQAINTVIVCTTFLIAIIHFHITTARSYLPAKPPSTMAVPAPMAENTRKRQFQPSIDSFFQRNGSTSAGSGSPSRLTSPLSPPIPADTQSSLLSVGMRVRKSVPEGYKTHKTMPTPEFPFPSTAPAAEAAPARPNYNTSNSRELAPFCGLHKVGGWSAQDSFTAPPSSAPAAFPHPNDIESSVPALSASQSTLQSTQSSMMSTTSSNKPANKRSYDDEVEQDMDAYFDEVEAQEQMPPIGSRPIAKLKRSPRKAAMGTTSVNYQSAIEGDFEDAPFLAPMETDT